MANSVLCKSCGSWIHGGCTKIKRVTNRLAIDFRCRKCNGCHENVEYHPKKLHDDVEIVTVFISRRWNKHFKCVVILAEFGIQKITKAA